MKLKVELKYYDDEEDVNKQEEEVEQECNDPREEQ